jgi:hypothetical protein
MYYYNGGIDEDMLIGAWWAEMAKSGDLALCVNEHAQSLSEFYRLFKSPNWLLVDLNDYHTAVHFAAWFEPTFDGAFFSLWAHPTRKNKRRGLELLHKAYEIGFEHYPVLIGITKQKRLLDGHKRLGYTLLGAIPFLFSGEDTYVLYLTKEAWQSARDKESTWAAEAKDRLPAQAKS